jgi:Ca2+-binding RTX toxin-like protein
VSSASGTLTFTMPAGYMLVAEGDVKMIDQSTYSMPVKLESGQLIFDIKLAYTVPAGGSQPDAAGFYDRSTIQMTFNGVGADGKTVHFPTFLNVGVREINSDADLKFTVPGTNQTVYAIPPTPGHNSVSAGAGNDTIYAGGAPDTIDGGGGVDMVSYTYSGRGTGATSGVGVTLEDGDGQAQVSGGGFEYGDILTHIENLEGSDFYDKHAGNSGDNHLIGGLRNDTLEGNAGADTLDGGAGANSLVGGTGNDVYVVSSQDDVILEKPNEGIDTVLVADLPGYTLSGNIEQLIYTGTGNFHGVGDETANLIVGAGGADTLEGRGGSDTLVGNDGNDLLKGGADGDSLVGGAGADTLDGGTGLDTMEGGAGNDVYVIDNQGDVVHDTEGNNLGVIGALGQSGGMFDAAGAAIPVNYTLAGDLHQLKYLGTSDATLVSAVQGNTLFGGTGNNSLFGAGQDSLVGNVGADTLGGVAADERDGGGGYAAYIGVGAGDGVYGAGY